MWKRPGADECAAYYLTVIEFVPEGDLPEVALAEMRELRALLGGMSDEAASRGYAPGKWSVKEVVGHLADVERIMAVRALCFARGDAAPFPGMEQDDYAAAAGHGKRSLPSLLDELESVRHATVSLMRSLDPAALDRRGEASGYEFTVRALCYHPVGHAIHHRRILRDRYLR